MALGLGPVIGKIGGGSDVTVAEVSGEQTGTSWKTIHTVAVPDGETWLVVAVLDVVSTGSNTKIRLGEMSVTQSGTASKEVLVVEGEGAASISLDLSAGTNARTATLTGTVYTVPLPD